MIRTVMNPRVFLAVLSLFIVGGLFAACGAPATAPTAPQVVRETVVVEATLVVRETVVIEGTPQVVERVVTATPEPTATPPPAGQPLESARLALNSRISGMDPHGVANNAGFITLFMGGGQLFRLNPDYSVVPYLAESYEMSDDGLTYTITLKPDLKFSDGSPLTSEDVVYGYERAVEKKSPRLNLLGPVESFTALDPRTIEIKLSNPYSNLLIGLSDFGNTIFPKAKLEADPDFFTKTPMVSSGQYVLTEWEPGASEWALEENPYFFGGSSMIKRVEFVTVPDQTSRVLQIVTGVIDYGYDIPPSSRADLPEEAKPFVVPLNGMYYIGINLEAAQDGPLGNPLVRQAISLAVDRQAIQDRAFFGISPAADTFLYKGPAEGIANLPNGGKRDVEAAKKLLAEAGYPDGGFGFTIQPWGERPGWTDAATVIKENLAEIGIEVTVDPKTDADAIANANAGTYETQFTGNVGDPLTYFSQLFLPQGLWYRWIRYNNPQVTELVTEAGRTIDAEKRIELLHQVQELLAEEMPYIPISERVVLVASYIPRNILCEANLGTGYNPTVATVQEFTSGTGPCK